MKVLFTGCTFSEKKIKQLMLKDIEIVVGNTNYSEEELIKELSGVDCYINGGDEVCTRRVIEKNQHLKLISFMGTGYQKYIDFFAAREYKIPVSFTPFANSTSVAEHTAALILDAVKKITFSNNLVKNGKWQKLKTFDLESKTLGIIGMGAIGTKVSKIMCDGFGMKLIYNSKKIKPEIDKKYKTKMISLKELFKKSDIICINATYTKETQGLIDMNLVIKLKPQTIIINTARAELVSKQALEYLLEKNHPIAMDGYYIEPIPDDDNILNFADDKVIITPHNAYNSRDALIRMENILIDSLEDVLKGSQIRNLIPKE